MIDTEKYQPARPNMKFVTRSLRSLATKFHILARQADIFGYQSINIQITYTYLLSWYQIRLDQYTVTVKRGRERENH